MGRPTGVDPVEALRRIAFLLERAGEATYRIRAFRMAERRIVELSADELAARVEAGTLTELPDLGRVTALVVEEAHRGETPVYLRRLEAVAREPSDGPVDATAERLRRALRGDLHSHTDWSDGAASLAEMARTARDLGHAYLAVTDHSPRLAIARGLPAERLERQLAEIERLNVELAPFRLLAGIEVDILDDGSLDQDPALLDRLDVVVASVHSKLAMSRVPMTERLVAAVANPRVDVLGHCTGRIVRAGGRRGGRRPESEFDAELVFDACTAHGTAVEINSRPDRLDPPERLLRLAVEAGCRFAIDSDAHAPGQLDWQPHGCARAVRTGVPTDAVVNTLDVEELTAWTRGVA